MTRTLGVVMAALLLVFTAPESVSAQTPETGWGGSPPARAGTHFLVWHGGSLEEAADVNDLVSLWVTFDGKFHGYFPNAPDFVNSAFQARFPGGTLPPNTPILVVIGPPATGALAAPSRLEFVDTCVWCATYATVELAPEVGSVGIRSITINGSASDQFQIGSGCTGRLRAPCELEVSFHPFRPGRSDARLEVRHSGSDSPLVVSLSGFGACERPSAQQFDLLEDAVGFGRDATGGANGCLVRVTSLEERGPGTLREAAERPGPTWIVFDVSGTIRLDKYIQVGRDKTLDGRGTAIAIEGAGLALVNSRNVVITNLEIHDVSEDGLQIRGEGTTDVWVSHVTIWNAADGYIDITQGAGDVTVSWSRFDRSPRWPQEKALLVGLGHLAQPNAPGGSDELTRVTVHHNLFNGTEQRSPLVRGTTVHSFNNYFNGWGIYGSAASSHGRLFSERNIYEHHDGSHADRAFTPWDEAAQNGGATAFIRSSGDRFLNGASGVESNPAGVPVPAYPYVALEPTDSLIQALLDGAGVRP